MRRVVPQPFPAESCLVEPAEFGRAVRAARTESGLSIEQAARGLGIAKQTLSDLEQGAPTVSLGTALHAAAQLGVALFMVPAARRELMRRQLQTNVDGA
jgi:transcriptional regulator with XRE-family HTH domain